MQPAQRSNMNQANLLVNILCSHLLRGAWVGLTVADGCKAPAAYVCEGRHLLHRQPQKTYHDCVCV